MARMRKRGSHAAPIRPARPDQDGAGTAPAENSPADPASGGTWPPGWSVTSPPAHGSGNGAAGPSAMDADYDNAVRGRAKVTPANLQNVTPPMLSTELA